MVIVTDAKSPCCGADFPYVYTWGNNAKRKTLNGRICRVLWRLPLNSAIVEFQSGQRDVISRNALRKCHKPIKEKK